MSKMSEHAMETGYHDYNSDLYEFEAWCYEEHEMYVLGLKVYQLSDIEEKAYNNYMEGGNTWDGTSERNVHSNTDMNSKDGQLIALRMKRSRSSRKWKQSNYMRSITTVNIAVVVGP